MKALKTILVIILGVLLFISIYRSLTIAKLEKLDHLLMLAYLILILIVSFMETIAKRQKQNISTD